MLDIPRYKRGQDYEKSITRVLHKCQVHVPPLRPLNPSPEGLLPDPARRRGGGRFGPPEISESCGRFSKFKRRSIASTELYIQGKFYWPRCHGWRHRSGQRCHFWYFTGLHAIVLNYIQKANHEISSIYTCFPNYIVVHDVTYTTSGHKDQVTKGRRIYKTLPVSCDICFMDNLAFKFVGVVHLPIGIRWDKVQVKWSQILELIFLHQKYHYMMQNCTGSSMVVLVLRYMAWISHKLSIHFWSHQLGVVFDAIWVLQI